MVACASWRRSRSRRSARARPAGRCPRCAPRAAGSRRRAPGSRAPGAGWRTARGPCAAPSRPCSGRGLAGSVVSHFGPPTAPSSTASARVQAASTSSVSAIAVRVDRGAAEDVLLDLDLGTAAEHLERRAHHLRPDAVARQRHDPRHRRAANLPAAVLGAAFARHPRTRRPRAARDRPRAAPRTSGCASMALATLPAAGFAQHELRSRRDRCSRASDDSSAPRPRRSEIGSRCVSRAVSSARRASTRSAWHAGRPAAVDGGQTALNLGLLGRERALERLLGLRDGGRAAAPNAPSSVCAGGDHRRLILPRGAFGKVRRRSRFAQSCEAAGVGLGRTSALARKCRACGGGDIRRSPRRVAARSRQCPRVHQRDSSSVQLVRCPFNTAERGKSRACGYSPSCGRSARAAEQSRRGFTACWSPARGARGRPRRRRSRRPP